MHVTTLLLESLSCALWVLAFVLVATLPVCIGAWLDVRNAQNPQRLLRQGVVVRSRTCLDAFGDVIGRYRDAPIHAFVVFNGVQYDYESIAPPENRTVHVEGALLLLPGVLYRVRS